MIEALSAAEGPVTPSDLLQVGRMQHQALGLVTVYRTLEILETLERKDDETQEDFAEETRALKELWLERFTEGQRY